MLEKSSNMLAKLMKRNSELKLAIVKVEPYAVELATAWRSCYSFKGAPVFLLVYDIFQNNYYRLKMAKIQITWLIYSSRA